MASKTVPTKNKSATATATDNPKEKSISTINVNKQTVDATYKVIVTASTASLSGTCELEYQLGLKSDQLGIRIHSTTGNGFHDRNWVSLNDAWHHLCDYPHDTITALALFPLWKYRSINTAGFILAALVSLKLLSPSEEKKRHWDLVSEDQYQATVQWLMKRHSASRKGKGR